jgi:hypothetical protein
LDGGKFSTLLTAGAKEFEMASIAMPSVMSLFLQMRFRNQILSTGTSFVVSGPRGPLLITNKHNVTGRNPNTDAVLSPTGGIPNEVNILHNAADRLGRWEFRLEPLYVDDRPLWYEHPLVPSIDVVALPLTQTVGVQSYPYNAGDTGPAVRVGPADVVSVIEFPFGLNAGGGMAAWATGFVASEPEVDIDDKPILLIDCRSRPGQSGSPVIAHRSGGMVALEDGSSAAFDGPIFRFIGIYSGRIRPESDLGIVWKVRAIKELVDSIPAAG